MPIAATSQAAPLAPRASGADARGQALASLPALTPSAHVPSHGAALEAWICALLLALFGRMEAIRQLFPQDSAYPIDEDDEETLRQIAHAIRAANRLRAWIGWILRFEPNRAMRRTFGRLTPELRAKPARAPPARARIASGSALKTPLPAAMTHARSPAPPRPRQNLGPPGETPRAGTPPAPTFRHRRRTPPPRPGPATAPTLPAGNHLRLYAEAPPVGSQHRQGVRS